MVGNRHAQSRECPIQCLRAFKGIWGPDDDKVIQVAEDMFNAHSADSLLQGVSNSIKDFQC